MSTTRKPLSNPDEALIEAMACAMAEADKDDPLGEITWPNGSSDAYRNLAGVALAVAREAGAL